MTERMQRLGAFRLPVHRYCIPVVWQLNGHVCCDIKFKMNDNLIRSRYDMLMVCECNYRTNVTG